MTGLNRDGVKLDIAQRVSYVSSTTKEGKDGDYTDIKTPIDDIEGGALRAGGAPNLLSRQNIGVLCHYATVGIMISTFPVTIYPFLQVYLNVDGKTYLTADTLVSLPWSLKIFYGILSDCLPIFGYRRRPYMVLGWSMCIAMLFIMSFIPQGRAYWDNPDDAYLDVDTPEYELAMTKVDETAPTRGGKYVMMMMLAAVGYLMANVCADGVVVELAQREPIEVRGRTQSAIYGIRTFTSIFGQLVTGFLFNGKEYGGDFDFSISFPSFMLALAIVTTPIVPIAWFFITEPQTPRVNFREYVGELWSLVQSKAVYQVIFYFFFQGVFSSISWTAASPVSRYLIGVTPLNNTLAGIIASFTFLAGIAITGKYGLAWSWRKIIIGTTLIVIVVDAIVTFISVWDVYRSQWFWLGVPLVIQVPVGINFIVGTFVVVELAGEGNEGAMYGLLTTVSNLSGPFAATITKIINRNWNFTNKRIQSDTDELRTDITYAVIIMYASSVFSFIFLYWLPRQKAETQELKRNGGSSFIFGAITVCYIGFALVWSIMVNIMGIYDSTSCLIIAGGNGC